MSKGNKMNVRKENGTTVFYIVDANGNEVRITSAEILEMKRSGKNAYLRDVLAGGVVTKKAEVVTPAPVEKPVEEKPKKKVSTWTSIPRHEIIAAGLTKDRTVKVPWYKKLFKGGE